MTVITAPPWDAFDPVEYVMRNYGQILPEDRAIIEHVIKGTHRLRFSNCKRVADVGAGPNFYPAMLLASLMEEGGSIELIEPSHPNRAFMRTLLRDVNSVYCNQDAAGKVQSIDSHGLWPKFENLMVELGGKDRFTGVFAKARKYASCSSGNIFALPRATYDFTSAFFVAESITNDKAQCNEAIRTLVQSVKPGGGFMVALMVGSSGWPAGTETYFPAVNLTMGEIRRIFDGIANTKSQVSFIKEQVKARHGYSGMAIAIGKRLPSPG